MKKTKLWLLTLVLVLSAFLAACGGNKADDDKDKADEGDKLAESGPQDGGTLVYSLDTEFKGLLDKSFYEDVVDDQILNFSTEGLTKVDENLEYQPNLAEWETDDNKVYTFKFKEGVKWHNGDELTVDDYIFALETIAHKDYTGARYNFVRNIEGAAEYHDGKADTISGVEKINDYEVKITFDKARVNNLENLWSHPMNRTAFEGVEVKDMDGSDAVRRTPVGLGPYKITNIVVGESIEMERHEDYWQGKPHIEKVILKVVSPEIQIGELKNGGIDFAEIHPTIASQVKEIEHVEVTDYPGISYFYIGMKHGKYDKANKKTIVDENPKYGDVNLRLAMAHAINREEWINAFMEGYAKPVNKPMPSSHWIAADDEELPNKFEFDPEKAKQLLDEAGYVDKDGDGFREDPNGDKFEINFAHYQTSNPTFEQRATAIKQYWEDVGLKTNLTMTEANHYYDQLENDDPSIEVFFAGWSTSADPDPSGLWKDEDLWNYPRYVDKAADKLLEDALDVELVGTDRDKRIELYKEWQIKMNENIPALWLFESEEVAAVNKRVKGVTFAVNGWNSPHEWWIAE